jgi:RimJ/RimL family protein N-acetyltransferase
MTDCAGIMLRPFNRDDFERLMSWVSTPEALGNWSAAFFKHPLDEDQLQRYLDSANQPNGRTIFTAVTPVGDAVGHVEISQIWPYLSSRLSRVLVAPCHRRLGIGRAMIARAIEFSFATHCVARIDVGVASGNLTAITCYRRLGFVEIGTWKHAMRVGAEMIDVIWMSLTQSAWTSHTKENA